MLLWYARQTKLVLNRRFEKLFLCVLNHSKICNFVAQLAVYY